MKVHAVCGYPGNSPAWNGKWDPPHYRARNLVKGVKHETFAGYSVWTEQPTGTPISQYANAAGQELALTVASSKIVALLDAAAITDAMIVPVPSSQTIAPHGDFTGARLARAIHRRRPRLVAAPVLYFDAPQPRAHEGGGERRANMILPHLRGGVGLAGPIVLLDDVMTLGGHLRACGQFIRALGYRVDHGFVIGRTLWERPEDMFAIPPEDLPD